MKITFVMLQLKLGGGNKVFAEIASKLAGKIDCSVVCSATEFDDMVDFHNVQVNIEGFKSKSMICRLAGVLLVYWKLIRMSPQSIYIFSDPFIAILMLFVPWKKKIRWIQADDYHLFDENSKMPKFLSGIYRWLISLSYKGKGVQFIFTSCFAYDSFVSVSRRAVPRIIINPGIDPESFFRDERIMKIPLRVAVLARKDPVKGLKIFENAMEILISKGSFDQIEKIVYFGSDYVEPFREKSITIRGTGEEFNRKILNQCDIFVFPSLKEGFGLPPLEAMACGCAVLSSDCGGVREYGIDGENIIFFESGNPDSLSKGMEKIVESLELREKLRRNGYRTVAVYGWQTAAEKLNTFLGSQYV